MLREPHFPVGRGERIDALVRVEAGGVAHHPHRHAGEALGLEAAGGARAGEGGPVGTDARNHDRGRVVGGSKLTEARGSCDVLLASEVGGAGCHAGNEVGEAEATVDEHRAVVWGEAVAGVDEVFVGAVGARVVGEGGAPERQDVGDLERAGDGAIVFGREDDELIRLVEWGDEAVEVGVLAGVGSYLAGPVIASAACGLSSSVMTLAGGALLPVWRWLRGNG